METRPQMQPAILKLWDSPKALQCAVDEYFQDRERPTWSGLALHLGFSSRTTMWNYLNGQTQGLEGFEAWLEPLKRGAAMIEAKHEERLYDAACVGSIFALKQRGWTDKQELAVGPSNGWQSLLGSLHETQRQVAAPTVDGEVLDEAEDKPGK